MPDTIENMPEEFDVAPPKPVVILSLLGGNTVYTHCPPGATLEEAKAVYLRKGAKKPKLLTEAEVVKAFPEAG